jgi:hypothetical protein
LDVIILTSIFKCIFFVAFEVDKQRNVEIDYHKCTKGRHSSIKKEGWQMGENLKVLSKKEIVHLKANLDLDGGSLIKWQDPQVETFLKNVYALFFC